MKRAAMMLAVSLAVSIVVVACASMQPGGRDLVTRAVSAQGGADALDGGQDRLLQGDRAAMGARAVGRGRRRDAPRQRLDAWSRSPTWPAGATRNDWVRNYQYPAPRSFTFSEIVTPQAGYVAGIDSNGRTKQSREANPPAHSMSSLRLAAVQRELLARLAPARARDVEEPGPRHRRLERHGRRRQPTPRWTIARASRP